MTQTHATVGSRAELHVQNVYRRKLAQIVHVVDILAQRHEVDLSSVKHIIFQPEEDHMAVYFEPYPSGIAGDFLFNKEICQHIAQQAKTELLVATYDDGYVYWRMR